MTSLTDHHAYANVREMRDMARRRAKQGGPEALAAEINAESLDQLLQTMSARRSRQQRPAASSKGRDLSFFDQFSQSKLLIASVAAGVVTVALVAVIVQRWETGASGRAADRQSAAARVQPTAAATRPAAPRVDLAMVDVWAKVKHRRDLSRALLESNAKVKAAEASGAPSSATEADGPSSQAEAERTDPPRDGDEQLAVKAALPSKVQWEVTAAPTRAAQSFVSDGVSCNVVPMRIALVDGSQIPSGTLIYISQTKGWPLSRGKKHDGFWFAVDPGGPVKDGRIDLYTGRTKVPWSAERRLVAHEVGEFRGCPK